MAVRPGIGIQFVENRLIAQIEGADAANATIDAEDLSVEALTRSYSGEYDNQSRFGVFASSGVGGGGDDDGGVGIAGAIALALMRSIKHWLLSAITPALICPMI